MFNKKWGSLDLQLFLVASAISGFQGDVDTDVEKPSWLGLRLTDCGHCYPSCLDDLVQEILIKIMHMWCKVYAFSSLETAELYQSMLPDALLVDVTNNVLLAKWTPMLS